VFGLTVPDLSNPFSSELAAGVLSAASSAGYGVFVSQADPGGPLERSLDLLLEHQVTGLVVSSLVDEDRELLIELLRRRIPVVQVIRRVEGVASDFIGIDDQAGARLEVEHLLRLGRTDIAVLAGPLNSSAQRARLAGYLAGLHGDGRSLPDERLAYGDLTRLGGYDATDEICRRAPEAPRAILCANDLMALGAIDALIDRGLRVPDDVAVVGFDDMSIASSRLIGLTTVRVPRRRLGAAAVDALRHRIAEPDAPPIEVLLPHSLVVRRTCGSPPPTIG
jgi:LacI family transcriptional regulator